jgi:hypothetical protein
VANYRVSTNTSNGNNTTQVKTNKNENNKKQRKMDQLRLLKLKHDFLKMSIDLQTAFAADTHLAEGPWLKEQLNVVKLRMFRVGTADYFQDSDAKGIY